MTSDQVAQLRHELNKLHQERRALEDRARRIDESIRKFRETCAHDFDTVWRCSDYTCNLECTVCGTVLRSESW